jgi:hypothetical protein
VLTVSGVEGGRREFLALVDDLETAKSISKISLKTRSIGRTHLFHSLEIIALLTDSSSRTNGKESSLRERTGCVSGFKFIPLHAIHNNSPPWRHS